MTEVAFEPKKYDSVTFTEDASAVMTVPEKFADEVQAAVFVFACAGECKSLVLQGKQFNKVAHERASISITSAGDITFEGDAFIGFTTTGDVVISAAGSLTFDGGAFQKLAEELRGEKYCDTESNGVCDLWHPAKGKIIGEIGDGPMVYRGDILLSSGGDLTWTPQNACTNKQTSWQEPQCRSLSAIAAGDFGTQFVGNIELNVGGNLKTLGSLFTYLADASLSFGQERYDPELMAKYTYAGAHIGDITLRVLGDCDVGDFVFKDVAVSQPGLYQGTVTIDGDGPPLPHPHPATPASHTASLAIVLQCMGPWL